MEIVDVARMTQEELAAWMMDDPEPLPLNSFPLHAQQGREGFLRELCAWGEPGLFAACSHIWSSLGEPVAARCTAMALTAGVHGTGKTGLRNTLLKFLEEALTIHFPIPSREGFPDLQSWNTAAQACFTNEDEQFEQLVTLYAAILGGRPKAKLALDSGGQVIRGPWLSND